MQISISNAIRGFRGGKNNVQKAVDAFKARVAADSGVFEAETCLKTTLTNLNKIQ